MVKNFHYSTYINFNNYVILRSKKSKSQCVNWSLKITVIPITIEKLNLKKNEYRFFQTTSYWSSRKRPQ